MHRLLPRVALVIICALLLIIGVSLVAEKQSFARLLCFSMVVVFATARWPHVSAVASSLVGVTAFGGSVLLLLLMIGVRGPGTCASG